MLESELSIRLCEKKREDARLILNWRNDPITLSMFYHRTPKQDEPFWNEYQSTYFSSEEAPPFFVLENGEPAAFLRFNKLTRSEFLHGNTYDVSINVNPAKRGRNIGTRALVLAQDFLKQRGIDTLVAEVRLENTASAKAFAKAGFVLVKETIHHVEDTGERAPIFVYVAHLTSGTGTSRST